MAPDVIKSFPFLLLTPPYFTKTTGKVRNRKKKSVFCLHISFSRTPAPPVTPAPRGTASKSPRGLYVTVRPWEEDERRTTRPEGMQRRFEAGWWRSLAQFLQLSPPFILRSPARPSSSCSIPGMRDSSCCTEVKASCSRPGKGRGFG